MRILEVSRYKDNFADHQLPFVTEQGTVIAKLLRDMQNDEMSRDKSLNEPHALNDESGGCKTMKKYLWKIVGEEYDAAHPRG